MDNNDSRLFRFPQVLRLEASAGSGKTYALAKRYVQLLINPRLKPEEIPLNSILAITFTNKAAIEMKERILELLKKIALDKFSNPKERENILSSLAVDEGLARAKAYKIMEALIRNYNFFQVQTIDSFINTILSGCAFRLELSANFKTKDDYRDYLAYSLDTLIDRAGHNKDIAGLFREFLAYYLLIENRTGWFPKQNILAIINSLFSETNKYSGRFIRADIKAQDLLSLKKDILQLLGELRDNLPEGTHKSFAASLENFLQHNKTGFSLDNLSDFFKRDELPLNRGARVSPKAKKIWDKIKISLRVLAEIESASTYNYYIDIFNEALNDLKIIASKEDVLFLEALNKEASALLVEGGNILPELYYRLACRFRHFLIDEFQDTSRLQWENLFPMIEDALAAEGSLFYVGDKKQAIYRFRGGEVSLIDSVKERFAGYNLIEEYLNKNYRSQKEIVEFNNQVFSPDNLRRFLGAKEDSFKKGWEFSPSQEDEIIKIFSGSLQGYKDDKREGFVKSEYLDYSGREERDAVLKEKVLNLIDELKGRVSFKDIAFLVRKNDEVELLSSWLLEKNIPVESEKTLDIRQNSLIKELVSFLKFLNSPIDNLSFASFILGEIFLNAARLEHQEIEDFIFTSRDKTREHVYLYRAFRLRFPGVWDKLIEGFFKSVGFIPLYELAVSILNKFNCLNNFAPYQGFFMRFLELIREEEEESSGLFAFLEFFEKAPANDLYVDVTESDAIKILTIHKSKGLEFPVVIIPFLEMNPKSGPGVVDKDNEGLKLMYIKTEYADFSPAIEGIYRNESLKSFIDELNSIYVAFTRAIDELYIFVSPKAERGLNLASLLLPENNFERGKRLASFGAKTRKKRLTLKIPVSDYRDWIPLLKDEYIEESVLKAREKITQGEICHCALSFIGNLYKQDKDLIIKQALEQARAQFPFSADLEGYEPMINNLVDDKQLKAYFEITEGEVFNEKEIVDTSGNTKRIDRLIVKEKEVLVIDYKSSRDRDSDYQKQIGEYVEIIRGIYPGRKVEGVLIYLDDRGIEYVGTQGHKDTKSPS